MDSLEPRVPAAKETGMVRNRDTSTPMEGGAVSLALWPFIPPGLNLWPRDRKPEGMGCSAWIDQVCRKAKEVGRGAGQGYFASNAGGREFESHLVHLGASSSVDRAPYVLVRGFPSSSFRYAVGSQ